MPSPGLGQTDVRTPRPLPGTEPGAGSLRWRRLARWLKLFLILGLIVAVAQVVVPSSTVRIGQTTFRVEVVEESDELLKGLSGRDDLPAGRGMLFVFRTEEHWPIWMKDMRFALDIIWFDAHQRVVDIEKNVTPETYPQAFTPAAPARYVLELPAGTVDAHNLRVGDQAVFDLKP